MKKIEKIRDFLAVFMTGALMLLILIDGLPSQGAEQPVGLSVSSSVSSAPADDTGNIYIQQETSRKAGLAGGASHIQVVNFFGPPMNMDGTEKVHRKLIDDYLSGNLNNGSGYVLIQQDGRVPWTSLCYAEGNRTPWLVLQQLIVAKGDSVSISQINVGQDATANVLDDNYAVGGRGYGPAAIGVKSDGTKIESGPGTQTANTVIFVTQMKMFNMAASHEGQKTVREYLLITEKNLNVTITATLNGTSTSSTASVVVVMPKLFLDTVWDPDFAQTIEVLVVGDAPGFPWDLYRSRSPTGPWIGVGEISSTEKEFRHQYTAGTVPHHEFFKALPRN